jgi:hypothetical protein
MFLLSAGPKVLHHPYGLLLDVSSERMFMISLIGTVSSLVDMFSTIEALRVFGRCS